MLSPDEALAEILLRVGSLARRDGNVEEVPIAEAVGRVLARPAISDLDLPPFEKSAMDGYAVHVSDFGDAAERSLPTEPPLPIERELAVIERKLAVVGEAKAGAPFTGVVPKGSCVAIYTGAEVPADCDAVVMVERTEADEERGEVVIRDAVRCGQNVCHRGQDLKLGGTVVEPGHRIRAADVSVLASVGCDPVPVLRRPRVSVLTTGDELVPPSAQPGPGQIREGNTLHLATMTRALGCEVVRSGILPDEPDALVRSFADALEHSDAVITTGGVSMGKYDLVGDAFAAVGVECVFHKVKIKPGKPLWFGLAGEVPVFALPGNPVSCLVGHTVFVRPALQQLAGEREPASEVGRGVWCGPDTEPNWREQHLPVARRVADDGRLELHPVPWNGSGDVVGLARADALARIPFDVSVRSGELVDFRPLV